MIKTISFKTNRNLGNMEHVAIELTYDVATEFEDPEAVFEELKATANKMLDTVEVKNEKPKPQASRAKRNK